MFQLLKIFFARADIVVLLGVPGNGARLLNVLAGAWTFGFFHK